MRAARISATTASPTWTLLSGRIDADDMLSTLLWRLRIARSAARMAMRNHPCGRSILG
jgi:hypothetical protein